MNNFYIIINTEKEATEDTAKYIESYLKSHGATCESKPGYLDTQADLSKIDCIITLGGDGTIISAAGDISGSDIPLMGINMGHIGYLTSVNKTDDIDKALDALLNDQYDIEKRMMISGIIDNNQSCNALNEIVITRKNCTKTIKLRVTVNGAFLNEYASDGIIIATPTGSTAYNLSAGGPIIEPGARMMVLTPICPHALNQRSIVLSADDELKIEIVGREDYGYVAVFDGDKQYDLTLHDSVIIKEAKDTTSLIRLNKGTFLDNLKNKMSGV